MSDAQDIYSTLLLTGITPTLCKYALAQAAHETANFTSPVYRRNNNAFGMTFAGQVNADGERGGYAYYKTVAQSVADWAAWWTRKRSNILSLPLTVNSIESFVRFLKNNKYFEAPENEYLRGVKHFYNLYFT